MADIWKDYTGKIVRVHYLAGDQEHSKTGIVYNQIQKGDNLDVTMLLTNGSVWQLPYKAQITKVTSVRMEEELRKALKGLYDAKLAYDKFLNDIQKQKHVLSNAVSAASSAVKEASNEMSTRDFMDAAENLFRKYFPNSGGFHSECYFSCNSMNSSEVDLTHIQEVEKYATPDRYSFLYRRYDGTMTFTSEDNGFNRFCERNAPSVISSLKPFAKISVDANIGDKGFLTASRIYTFALPKGCTKESLRYLQDILDGKVKVSPTVSNNSKKKALSEQIQNAADKRKRTVLQEKFKEPSR